MRSAYPARGVTVAVALLAALFAGLMLLSACTSQPAPAAKPESAADVVSRLGAVPIPTGRTGAPAPEPVSIGHPQLLAMGDPIDVTLPGGVRGLVTTSGPTEDLPPGGAKPGSSVTGTITLTVTPSAGTFRLAAADLQSRDDTGSAIALRAVGPAVVTASPGHTATLVVSGTFQSGSAQLNWSQQGHVLAIWDFNIEID
jgi:hypothetical protein